MISTIYFFQHAYYTHTKFVFSYGNFEGKVIYLVMASVLLPKYFEEFKASVIIVLCFLRFFGKYNSSKLTIAHSLQPVSIPKIIKTTTINQLLHPRTMTLKQIGKQRSLSKVLNDNEKWLDLLDHGYYLCDTKMRLLYLNKKGEQIMNELNTNFRNFIDKLTNTDNSKITLNSIIKELINTGKEGDTKKAEYNFLNSLKGDKTLSFTGEQFWVYKTRVWKLNNTYILITMKKKDNFGSIIINKKYAALTKFTLSHELKTLLNGIIGNLELIEEVVDKQHLLFYRFALSSSHMLSNRLNDFFDYIQIQDDEFKIHKDKFLLENLIGNVKEVCRWYAEQKSLSFITTIDSSAPIIVNGDRQRIAQILLSLLHKTIEYTDYGTISLIAKLNKNDKIGRAHV